MLIGLVKPLLSLILFVLIVIDAWVCYGNLISQVVKSALAETPLGPMASSIPSFGAEAASGPAHMNPVSKSPCWPADEMSVRNFPGLRI